LEAIFLSTFVMISQNRADAKRQVIANQQWMTVQEEDKQNRELLDLFDCTCLIFQNAFAPLVHLGALQTVASSSAAFLSVPASCW
jgi:uncharacterized membrane protein